MCVCVCVCGFLNISYNMTLIRSISAVRTCMCCMQVQLSAPAELLLHGYGAPTSVFLTASTPSPQPRPYDADADADADGDEVLGLEVVWVGKRAARLYESIYFGMKPILQHQRQEQQQQQQQEPGPWELLDSSSNNHVDDAGGGWQLLIDKLGSEVDAADVVTHGGSAVHGTDPNGGVQFRPQAAAAGTPSLVIKSLDAGLVLPAAAQSVWNFTAFYRGGAHGGGATSTGSTSSMVEPRDGVSWNLMNNLYWTNYVLWYPWRQQEDATSRFRFKLFTMQ
eukprot:COSAG05_NODE_37_length_27688_cov_18.080394_24_plen_279_part_00